MMQSPSIARFVNASFRESSHKHRLFVFGPLVSCSLDSGQIGARIAGSEMVLWFEICLVIDQSKAELSGSEFCVWFPGIRELGD
jgi:hypothetical protein